MTKKKLFLLALLSFGAIFFVHTALAQNTLTNSDLKPYQLLAPLPLTNPNGNTLDTSVNIATYIPNVVRLIIGLAGGLAVLMLIFGGFKYIASVIPTVKEDGKEMIQNALIGLLLVLASYSILYTLNPKLVKLSLSLTAIKDGAPIDGSLASSTGADSSGGSNAGAPAGVNNCGSACQVVQIGHDFPSKGPNGGACDGDTCYIDPALDKDLQVINQDLIADKIGWTVTEMTPPVASHLDHCHSNGTCVDATLSDPTPANIVKLFTALDSTSGITGYEYETCNTTTLNSLKTNTLLTKWRDKFTCETSTSNGASGQSFHIEGPNANNTSFAGGAGGSF